MKSEIGKYLRGAWWCLWVAVVPVGAQQVRKLSLTEAIEIAKRDSYAAQVARYSFLGQYWNYRSYRAELLPSLNLSGGVMNFDRSIVEARDPDTGRISYVDNNSLSNDLTLSVDQNIPFLGGTLSLQSSLSRLDQFNYDLQTYNTVPLILNYTQPIRAYNALKWRKKTAPLQYENAQRAYLETMQDITINVTNLFFTVLSAQENYRQSVADYEDRKHLFEIAKKRLDLGTTTKSEVLQMELSLLNAKMSVNSTNLTLRTQLFLFAHCGLRGHRTVATLLHAGNRDERRTGARQGMDGIVAFDRTTVEPVGVAAGIGRGEGQQGLAGGVSRKARTEPVSE